MDDKTTKLVGEFNVLDTHAMILYIISESKSFSFEMEGVKKLINPDCQDKLELKEIELFALSHGMNVIELAEVIGSVNTGFIRSELRTIWRTKITEK